jgi:hypothetical protein
MRLTARKLGRHDKSDLLVCTRDDGSTAQVAMPRQGVLPHDLLHFIVETALPMPALAGIDLEAQLFDRARRLHDEWMQVPQQQSLALEFNPD